LLLIFFGILSGFLSELGFIGLIGLIGFFFGGILPQEVEGVKWEG
jgi:hypothetical protein